MSIEWDIKKAKSNLKKHGVSFEEAQTVLEDDFAQTIDDDDHSFEEKRFITIGESLAKRLLVVFHTIEGDYVRIISARKPTRGERQSYEEGI
jgi:uncharacterized DUF497 family protein